MQYNVLTKGASYPYKSLSASSILPLLSLTLCFFSFCLYPPLPRAWMSVCLNESFIQVFPKKKKHLKTYQTPCHILCMDEHLYIIQTIVLQPTTWTQPFGRESLGHLWYIPNDSKKKSYRTIIPRGQSSCALHSFRFRFSEFYQFLCNLLRLEAKWSTKCLHTLSYFLDLIK